MPLTAERWQALVHEVVAVRGILQQSCASLAADPALAEELLRDADSRLRRAMERVAAGARAER